MVFDKKSYAAAVVGGGAMGLQYSPVLMAGIPKATAQDIT